MEAVPRSAWRDQPPERNVAIESALAHLIDLHGFALFMQAGRLRRLLAEAAPGSDRHIAVVVVALSAEIPQRLRAAKSDATLPVSLQRSVRYLEEHAGLEAGWATWAVAVWAHALQLPTASLGIAIGSDAPSERTGPSGPAAPKPTAFPERAAIDRRRDGRQEPDFRQSANDTDVGADRPMPADEADGLPILLEPLFPERRPPREAAPRSPAAPLPSNPLPATAPPLTAPPDRRPGRSVAIGVALLLVGLVVGYLLRAPDRPVPQVAPSRPTPLEVAPPPGAAPPIEPAATTGAPPQVAPPVDVVEPAPPTPDNRPVVPAPVAENAARERLATTNPPCSSATCGTVASAREITTADGATGFVYEITVRMGDGRLRTFAARYRLEDGSRVRMVGDRFVPIGSRRP